MPFQCIRCKKEIDPTFRNCPHCGEAITDFARRYADEPVDGKYRIVERLGAGGMGEVFKVVHTFLGNTRVIKVIRPHISDSHEAHDRFLREARASTKVQHPNVATLHDFAQLPDGSHYMVWEYIDGENLAQRLRKTGPMNLRAALRITIQALHGLDAIHRAGIIHRDISPENLMITHADDSVKIIDLGVAKLDDTSATMATATGIFVGKLRYASPEHLGFLNDDEKIDGRADLYSMAMVLYELVTGRPPFEATSPHQYFILHSQEKKLQAIDYANVPVPLRDTLRKALEHDRNKRYANAREFAAALEAVEREIPDQSEMATLAETPLPASALAPPPPPQVDTLHRQTQKSEFVAPVPAKPPAPPTVITQGATRRDDRGALIAVILAVLLIVGAAAAWFFWPRKSADHVEASVVTPPAPVKTQTTAPPPPSATAVDVIATTTTAAPITTTTQQPVLTEPHKTETIAPPPPQKIEPQPQPPQEDTEPLPEPEPAQPAVVDGVPLYVDGGDNDDANNAAMERLREAMAGVTKVAVHAGSSMRQDVIESIRENVSGVSVVDFADVVVQFHGSLEPLGRGRKLRSARATVKKNGRVVFRYELPREVYRVGATPAEAFARVLSDAF